MSVFVKGDLHVVAQMLDSPYMAFMRRFGAAGDVDAKGLTSRDVHFTCAVTRQFMKHSVVAAVDAPPIVGLDVPRLRIAAFVGTRERVVWGGTPRERRFFSLEAASGGRLLDRDPKAPAAAGVGTLVRDLAPEDFAATKGIELDVVWTYPLLNERLWLIYTLGKPVDPLKELRFDRPMSTHYRTFIDILASHGGPSEWGYPPA